MAAYLLLYGFCRTLRCMINTIVVVMSARTSYENETIPNY